MAIRGRRMALLFSKSDERLTAVVGGKGLAEAPAMPGWYAGSGVVGPAGSHSTSAFRDARYGESGATLKTWSGRGIVESIVARRLYRLDPSAYSARRYPASQLAARDWDNHRAIAQVSCSRPPTSPARYNEGEAVLGKMRSNLLVAALLLSYSRSLRLSTLTGWVPTAADFALMKPMGASGGWCRFLRAEAAAWERSVDNRICCRSESRIGSAGRIYDPEARA